MKRLFLLILCFLMISCKECTSDFIDGGDYKYWRFVAPHCSLPDFYYFDTSGIWTIFKLCPDGTFKKYDGFDDILTEEWNLKGDSILHFNGYDHRIMQVNDSIMILQRKLGFDTLWAAQPDIIPQNMRCKQHVSHIKTIYE